MRYFTRCDQKITYAYKPVLQTHIMLSCEPSGSSKHLYRKMRFFEGAQCDRAEQRPLFRGFCHLCKSLSVTPAVHYIFFDARGKVCTSDLLQSADILEYWEKRIQFMFRAFFKEASAFTLVSQRRGLVIQYLKHERRK